jgi:hypothetical protein
MTTDAEVTIGLAEIVEALFDHRGATAATASLMGIHIPLENILPEYSEVSSIISWSEKLQEFMIFWFISTLYVLIMNL